MKSKTPIEIATSGDPIIEEDRAERELALEYIAEAWNMAEDDGIEPKALAHASLFAAITTMVKSYGEQATAELIARLPDRIRSGEYNLDRTMQ
jgi:hypothetical protein